MSSQLLDVPHKHPSSIWSFADDALTLVREAVLTAGYGPLTTLAEKAVVSYEPFIRSVIHSAPRAYSQLNPQRSSKYLRRSSTNCHQRAYL